MSREPTGNGIPSIFLWRHANQCPCTNVTGTHWEWFPADVLGSPREIISQRTCGFPATFLSGHANQCPYTNVTGTNWELSSRRHSPPGTRLNLRTQMSREPTGNGIPSIFLPRHAHQCRCTNVTGAHWEWLPADVLGSPRDSISQRKCHGNPSGMGSRRHSSRATRTNAPTQMSREPTGN